MTSRSSSSPSAWRPSVSQQELLSFGQLALRLNDFVSRSVRIQGALDASRLERAVSRCIQRHRILTGSFVDPSDPRIALDAFTPRLDYDQDATRSLRPLFDSPLVAISLQTRSPTDAVLHLSALHAVMDARSMSILLRDLFASYSDDGVGPIKPSGFDFGDWSASEAQKLASPRRARLRAFWRTQLEHVGPLPSSGFARDGRRAEDDLAEHFLCTLEGSRARFISAIATSTKTSEFTVISALWKTVLRAMRTDAGQPADSPVSVLGAFPNRMSVQYSNEIGAFANSAVLVSDIPPSASLYDLVAEEGDMLFLAACHQDYPHAAVTSDLDPSLYGVRFAAPLEKIPRYVNLDMPYANSADLPAVAGLRLSAEPSRGRELPRGGMRVVIDRRDDSWVLDGRFDLSVYSRQTIARCLSTLDLVVTRWMDEPHLPVWRLLSYATG